MKLYKQFLTNNDCYKAGKTIKPVGIVVHSTGANNPRIKRYVQPDDGVLGKNAYSNDWNHSGISKCVHAFVGTTDNGDVAVYQTLPWTMRCWGVGSGKLGSYNNSHIQFEICEDDLTSVAYFTAVYKSAVELCVMLCKEYGIDPKNIVCHKEANRLGYGSDHADVEHWFPKFGKSMDTFRKDVADALKPKEEPKQEKPKEQEEEMTVYRRIEDVPKWGKPTIQKLADKGVLNGDGNGNLDITEDLLRTLVILERLKVF